MQWLRRFLGDDVALQRAIEEQSSKIAALTDRVDERIRAQSTGFERVGSNLNETLQTQTMGIEQVGMTLKESLRSQAEALSTFTKRLEVGLEQQLDGLTQVSKGIRDIKALPLPVQTFPLIEDSRWEKEKRQAAQISEGLFYALDKNFIEILGRAEDTVLRQTETFIKEINTATTTQGNERQQAVKRSLDGLLACSPKKIIASFQKHSLEVGWAYIYTFNRIVDGLAEWFPRCRSGIYASRLKYSDVIQVAEEVLTTLRACSTLLEDLQRRYDLLEALQANVQADLDDPACERIWRALKHALSDAVKNFGHADDAGLWEKTWKKTVGGITSPITGVAGLMAATSAQFNEQMTREQRLMVFLKTALMFCAGWGEWREASKRIVTPNLHILFAMKRDHVRNQVLSMCDLVNYNNYPLDGTCKRLLELGALPSIIATWRKHAGPYGLRTCTLHEDGSFIIPDELSQEWSGGRWKWDHDILVFTYNNGEKSRHAFHGPDKFSELHNDEFWYERMIL